MGYSKIERDTDHDERVSAWPRFKRDVWKYLLANRHMEPLGVRLGCYVLDPMYAAADLTCVDWEPTRSMVVEQLESLHADERIVWDPKLRMVLILNFLKHNRPPNPAVVKACVGDVDNLPYSEPIFSKLLEVVDTLLPEKFEKGQIFRADISNAIRARLGITSYVNELDRVDTVSDTVSARSGDGLDTVGHTVSSTRAVTRAVTGTVQQNSDANASGTEVPSSYPQIEPFVVKPQTPGQFMHFVRALLYKPDSEGRHVPPPLRSDGQDFDTLRTMLERGIKPTELLFAIEAAAAMRDAGRCDFAKPEQSISMGILYAKPRKGQGEEWKRPFWPICVEWYSKRLETNPDLSDAAVVKVQALIAATAREVNDMPGKKRSA